jgi:hypothetical protein
MDHPLEIRARNLAVGLPQVIDAGLNFMLQEYRGVKALENALWFTEYALVEGLPSDVESLKRIGWFPQSEARIELDEALNQILLGAYKSSYDNLRRAMEMTVVSLFFASSSSTVEDARKWMNGETNTPFFSNILDVLFVLPHFQALNAAINWKGQIKAFYWSLSDVMHVRGMPSGIRAIQPLRLKGKSGNLLRRHITALEQVLDVYVFTIRHICTLLAAYNPVLLVGLPLYEKFGPDVPVGLGFYDEQARKLFSLVLEDAKPCFKKVVEEDRDVIEIVKHIEGLPDFQE